MANTNATVINCFSACGHVVYLYELSHPLCNKPRYIFIDKVLTPKEKDNGYDFEFNQTYISEVYDSKEEAESKFNKLRYAYLFDAHAMIPEDDEYKNLTVVLIRSDLCEKYMDSIMDKIVTITDVTATDNSIFKDFESGFYADFNLKFKINDIEFTAEAYTRYGECANGENPCINIVVHKDGTDSAFITDSFDLYINHEHNAQSAVRSSNNVFATDIGNIDPDIKDEFNFSIPKELDINLTSLGRFLVNRVYQEINGIISKVEQKA